MDENYPFTSSCNILNPAKVGFFFLQPSLPQYQINRQLNKTTLEQSPPFGPEPPPPKGNSRRNKKEYRTAIRVDHMLTFVLSFFLLSSTCITRRFSWRFFSFSFHHLQLAANFYSDPLF